MRYACMKLVVSRRSHRVPHGFFSFVVSRDQVWALGSPRWSTMQYVVRSLETILAFALVNFCNFQFVGMGPQFSFLCGSWRWWFVVVCPELGWGLCGLLLFVISLYVSLFFLLIRDVASPSLLLQLTCFLNECARIDSSHIFVGICLALPPPPTFPGKKKLPC